MNKKKAFQTNYFLHSHWENSFFELKKVLLIQKRIFWSKEIDLFTLKKNFLNRQLSSIQRIFFFDRISIKLFSGCNKIFFLSVDSERRLFKVMGKRWIVILNWLRYSPVPCTTNMVSRTFSCLYARLSWSHPWLNELCGPNRRCGRLAVHGYALHATVKFYTGVIPRGKRGIDVTLPPSGTTPPPAINLQSWLLKLRLTSQEWFFTSNCTRVIPSAKEL